MVLYLILVELLMVIFLVYSMNGERVWIVRKSNSEVAMEFETDDCFLYMDFGWNQSCLPPSLLPPPLCRFAEVRLDPVNSHDHEYNCNVS